MSPIAKMDFLKFQTFQYLRLFSKLMPKFAIGPNFIVGKTSHFTDCVSTPPTGEIEIFIFSFKLFDLTNN